MASATAMVDAYWRAHRTSYYVLTPKQLEEFNKKYEHILTGEDYVRALHTHERRYGYRVIEPSIN